MTGSKKIIFLSEDIKDVAIMVLTQRGYWTKSAFWRNISHFIFCLLIVVYNLLAKLWNLASKILLLKNGKLLLTLLAGSIHFFSLVISSKDNSIQRFWEFAEICIWYFWRKGPNSHTYLSLTSKDKIQQLFTWSVLWTHNGSNVKQTLKRFCVHENHKEHGIRLKKSNCCLFKQ